MIKMFIGFLFLVHIFCAENAFGQIVKNQILNNSISNSEQQNSTKSEQVQKEESRAEFPVFQNTGNSKRDIENHRIAKENWIKENPVLYKKMCEVEKIISISKEEFNTFSIEKQSEITSHPEKYKLQ